MSEATKLLEEAKYDLGAVLYEPVGEIVQYDFHTLALDWWARKIEITDIRVGGWLKHRVHYYHNSVEIDLSKVYEKESEAKEAGRRIAEQTLRKEIDAEYKKIEQAKKRIAELETAVPGKAVEVEV